jgi:hypothetical protein
MPYENSAGLNVFNQYGVRNTGGSLGKVEDDVIQFLSVDFTAESLIGTYVPNIVLPKGAHFLRYILRVDEVFTMTGTSPTVIFGGTAPATDGIVLTAAELAAVGTKIPASAGTGTWATNHATGPLTAQKITKALGGTTPAVTPGAGKATLIAEYIYKTKV